MAPQDRQVRRAREGHQGYHRGIHREMNLAETRGEQNPRSNHMISSGFIGIPIVTKKNVVTCIYLHIPVSDLYLYWNLLPISLNLKNMKGRLTLHVNFLKQVPEGEAKMVEADQKAEDLNNVYTIYIYVHHL